MTIKSSDDKKMYSLLKGLATRLSKRSPPEVIQVEL